MAQNYYSVEKAAQVLGTSADEIRAMLERRELHGYRDGSSWKFKSEDIDRLASQRSEGALGGGSDIQLADALGAGKPGAAKARPAKAMDADEFDLAMDDDLTHDVGPVAKKSPAKEKDASKSDILSDDDMVLGGSGLGSDITLGGDSGINLVAPSDSGLSLEAPSSGDDSLELGEDDMVSLGDDSQSPTKLRADEEFLLSPAEATGDEDEESGSQVIALDAEATADQAATMIGSPSTASMVAMLDEDMSRSPLSPTGSVGLAAVGMGAMGAAPMASAEPVVVEADFPETPYSGLQVFGLAVCTVILVLCGMMAFDLVRNMWSWNGPYQVNSSIMDKVLSIIGS